MYKCKNNYIVDSCTGSSPQNGDGPGSGVNSDDWELITEGYIKKFDGELYYSSYAKTNNIKLFATDIVSLGAITDCDWEGIPKIYEAFIDTTYQRPPLSPDMSDVYPGTVDVSGFDDGGVFDDNALIANVNCLGIFTGSQQCNNIKRICELGFGLDENRMGEGLNPNGPPGPPVDSKMTNQDIDNSFIRGAFAYANGLPLSNNGTIPLVLIDSGSESSSGGFSNYLNTEYRAFRGYITSKKVWQYQNSFYFYFGLIPGFSAIQNMERKYFAPCEREKDVDFFCVATEVIIDDDSDVPTGAITVEAVGGIAPYTYSWTGPTFVINGVSTNFPQNPDPTSPTITDLYAGTYYVKIIDGIGRKTECSFIVPGPAPVSCFVDIDGVSQFGASDGGFTINAQQGQPPYTYLVEAFDIATNTALSSPAPQSGTMANSSVTVGGDNDPSNGYPIGSYRITVTDSGSVQSQCIKFVNLTEPIKMGVNIETVQPNCASEGGAAFVIVTGGTAPYDIEWNTTPPQSSSTISGLQSGTYTVTITDSQNAVKSSSTSIIVPPPLSVIPYPNNNTINVIMQTTLHPTATPINNTYGTASDQVSDGVIKVKPQGGTPPYTVSIDVGTPQTNINSGEEVIFSKLTGDELYTVSIEDANGCTYEIDTDLYKPDEQLYGAFAIQQYGVQNVYSRIFLSIRGGHGAVEDNIFPNGRRGFTNYILERSKNGASWSTYQGWNRAVYPSGEETYSREYVLITPSIKSGGYKYFRFRIVDYFGPDSGTAYANRTPYGLQIDTGQGGSRRYAQWYTNIITL